MAALSATPNMIFSFFFFFFLSLFYCTPPSLSKPTTSTSNQRGSITTSIKLRRFLHEPLYPLPQTITTTHSPPSLSPSPSTFPKYPSDTNPTPFFPYLPSPPPPPPPPLSTANPQPTFPANISGPNLPSSPHPSSPITTTAHHHHSTFLIPAVVLPILAFSILAFLSAFLLHRRRHRPRGTLVSGKDPSHSDNHLLFPGNSAKLSASSAPHSSEFHYLEAVVNSRSTSIPPVPASRSPELQPLPPLSRHRRHFDGSSSDEFYSPTHSPTKAAAAAAAAADATSAAGSPSYPSSHSIASRSPRSDNTSAASPTFPPLPPPPSTDGFRINEVNSNGNPPPPPPPPPAEVTGFPPALVPPKNASLKSAAVFPADSEEAEEIPRLKLKPLHWDKVRASSDRVMAWDHLKSNSFQLNEEVMEKLFVSNAAAPREMARRQLPPPVSNQEIRVLDPKKSQNIAILLRALNVTKEEVCEALLEGNADSLGTELLETLLKMAPSKEEEARLREYKDDSPVKLGPAEKFLKTAIDIPFAFKRVEAMLYITNFDSEVNYLKNSFSTLEAACEELRNSRMFLKLLEAVLKTGNRMNVGTNRGEARAFKLDTLLKLVDVKGTDKKTTLLHFVVQEITRAEGSRLSSSNQTPSNEESQPCSLSDDLELKRLGLQVVSGLCGDLGNVKKAAAMDCDMLGNYVAKLSDGIGKVREVIEMNSIMASEGSGQRFHETMAMFLKKGEDDIIKVQAQESLTLSLVKEITEYFHGDSAREEAHPFRIFMVVRDFLSILDQVCKEVGKINERAILNSTRNMTMPASTSSPPTFLKLNAPKAMEGTSSEEDQGNSSSS